ncbi:uncharacterized protein LOC126325848 [Schistocerca gregaria]|uniref:uncharacterized protein LOC126325848 n=1 Tax=Schistocerca gregaria TaxID=7010 RepID=UPI00211DAB2E|nr:uncharacterized protein LOC126325848 [Schistocerca gregaria]
MMNGQEDQDLNLEDFYTTLDRIKSKAEIVATILKGLQFPCKWQILMGQFSALSKQYRMLNEEFTGLMEECRFIYPSSLEGLQNPHIVPEILRTRMEPEFENDHRNLAEEWKKKYGENQISISEVEEQIDAYERMCGNLLDILANLVETEKSSRPDSKSARSADIKPQLRRFLTSIEKGSELCLTDKTETLGTTNSIIGMPTVGPSISPHTLAYSSHTQGHEALVAGAVTAEYPQSMNLQAQAKQPMFSKPQVAIPHQQHISFTMNQNQQPKHGVFAQTQVGGHSTVQTATKIQLNNSQLQSAAINHGFPDSASMIYLSQPNVTGQRGQYPINLTSQQSSRPLVSSNNGHGNANITQSPTSTSTPVHHHYYSHNTMSPAQLNSLQHGNMSASHMNSQSGTFQLPSQNMSNNPSLPPGQTYHRTNQPNQR